MYYWCAMWPVAWRGSQLRDRHQRQALLANLPLRKRAALRFDTSGFALHKRNCTTSADKRRFLNTAYYIRDYAVSAGDGIPTLMQSSFDLTGGALIQQDALAMVEGIEAMRFVFGVDNLSDTGAAVDYSQPVQWASALNRNSPTNRGRWRTGHHLHLQYALQTGGPDQYRGGRDSSSGSATLAHRATSQTRPTSSAVKLSAPSATPSNATFIPPPCAPTFRPAGRRHESPPPPRASP